MKVVSKTIMYTNDKRSSTRKHYKKWKSMESEFWLTELSVNHNSFFLFLF